jgi:hypothetical protein
VRTSASVLMIASVGLGLACSDRSPTSPVMATGTAASGAAATAGSSAASPSGVAGRRGHAISVSPRGLQVFGSDQAKLAIAGGTAKLEIKALTLPSGACFGTYGQIDQPIPNGPFSLHGSFTQLIGAFPGKIDYSADFSGVVETNQITITVTVPAIQQSFGPFVLTNGVNPSWTPCLYP